MFPKLNCVFIFKTCVSQPKFVFVVTWWLQKNTKTWWQTQRFHRPAGLFPTVRAKSDVQTVEMRQRISMGFHVVLALLLLQQLIEKILKNHLRCKKRSVVNNGQLVSRISEPSTVCSMGLEYFPRFTIDVW